MINYRVLKKPTQMLIKETTQIQLLDQHYKLLHHWSNDQNLFLVATNSMGCDHQTFSDQKSFDHWNYGDQTVIEHFDCQNCGNQKCVWIILIAKTMMIEQFWSSKI